MKSIKFNSIIYSAKTIIGMVFPLLTFTYVARVLSVEAIGKVNFSASIVSYFSLFAGLGIYTFAVKGGAGLRDNKEQLEVFCSEIFTINLITTVLSYLVFFVLLSFNSKWSSYSIIMLIVSINIILTTLGVDWLYTIYEEYLYTTVRTLIVQIISVCFLFLFVKSDKDIILYSFYTVMVSVGSNIFNIFRSRKYVKLRIIFTDRMLGYLKPILILFSTTIATQIFLNSDITVLGYLASDKDVGLYHASVKVYTMVKTILLSIGTVSMPRLAYFVGKKDYASHTDLFARVLKTLLFIIIPCTFGLSAVSRETLLLFAGGKYEEATLSLSILAFTLPFSILGSLFSSGLLVPYSLEKKILIATSIAATSNVILNIVLIPIFGFSVAAATTVFSEGISTIIVVLYSKKYLKGMPSLNILKDLIAGLLMLCVCIVLKKVLDLGLIPRLIIIVLASAITYTVISLALKNDALYGMMKSVANKVAEKHKSK